MNTGSSEIFGRFKRNHRLFVETGTLAGDGVIAALGAGYTQVISIEAAKDLHAKAVIKFSDNPKVKLILGRSEIELPKLLSTLAEPATFWLDAHAAWGQMLDGTNLSPLRAELTALAAHPVKSHTILIDDIRTFPQLGTSLTEIIRMVKAINSSYIVEQIDSVGYKEDILAAHCP